jgi:hypothetical protein
VVTETRNRKFDAAVGRMCGLLEGAVNTMQELMQGDNKPWIRLVAARAILEALPKLRETAELAGRVESLRQLILNTQNAALEGVPIIEYRPGDGADAANPEPPQLTDPDSHSAGPNEPVPPGRDDGGTLAPTC